MASNSESNHKHCLFKAFGSHLHHARAFLSQANCDYPSLDTWYDLGQLVTHNKNASDHSRTSPISHLWAKFLQYSDLDSHVVLNDGSSLKLPCSSAALNTDSPLLLKTSRTSDSHSYAPIIRPDCCAQQVFSSSLKSTQLSSVQDDHHTESSLRNPIHVSTSVGHCLPSVLNHDGRPNSTSPSRPQQKRTESPQHPVSPMWHPPVSTGPTIPTLKSSVHLSGSFLPSSSRHVYSPAHLQRLRHDRRLPLPSTDPVALLGAKRSSLQMLPLSTSHTLYADVLLSAADAKLTFADLGLPSSVLSKLSAAGYTKPSPVQLRTIPRARLGGDLIAHSKSGTGKTLAYVLATLDSHSVDDAVLASKLPLTLVLVPTRELASQIAALFSSLNSQLSPVPNVAAVVGGTDERTDRRTLTELSPSIVVGTPGRVRALASAAVLSLHAISVIVLDEADRLLEPSFAEDVQVICNLLPETRQTLAFSATFPPWLRRILFEIMRNPAYIAHDSGEQNANLDEDEVASSRKVVLLCVCQEKLAIPDAASSTKPIRLSKKLNTLISLLRSQTYQLCIVFVSNKRDVQKAEEFVKRIPITCRGISAGLRQSSRSAIMSAVRKGQVRVLVATDLLARGIDLPTCDLVVHLDVPTEAATYLHRVGRAGRFGRRGRSIVIFLSKHDADAVKVLESKLGYTMQTTQGTGITKEEEDCEEKKASLKSGSTPEGTLSSQRKKSGHILTSIGDNVVKTLVKKPVEQADMRVTKMEIDSKTQRVVDEINNSQILSIWGSQRERTSQIHSKQVSSHLSNVRSGSCAHNSINSSRLCDANKDPVVKSNINSLASKQPNAKISSEPYSVLASEATAETRLEKEIKVVGHEREYPVSELERLCPTLKEEKKRARGFEGDVISLSPKRRRTENETSNTLSFSAHSTEDSNPGFENFKATCGVLFGDKTSWDGYALKARQEGYVEGYARAYRMAFEMKLRLHR